MTLLTSRATSLSTSLATSLVTRIQNKMNSPFLYLFILLCYLPGLWGMSIPLTGDQKTYLSIALEMKEKGSWIVPYLFGEPNFLKPPFQYWMTLLGWKVFGLSLFGALIPSVIALIGSAYLVNRLSRLFGGVSVLPGLFFAASLGSMTYGTTAQMEIWIVFFNLWAWFEFLRKKWFFSLILVGVMAWIKGPLYSVLWVLSTVLYLALEKRKSEIKSWKWGGALALGALVGLSWYWVAAQSEFQKMIETFFVRENLGKIRTHQGNPLSLWGEFLYSLLPWVLWMVVVISRDDFKKHIQKQKNFWIAYAALPALFFTFFPYRVNTYLFILTPLAAWIAGASSEQSLKSFRERWFFRAAAILTAVLSGVLLFIGVRLVQGGWIGIELGCVLFLALFLWVLSFWRWNGIGFGIASLLLVNGIRVGAVQIGERDLSGLRHYLKDNHQNDHYSDQQNHLGATAYWIQDQDIWHEFGLISAATSIDIHRIFDFHQANDFLKSGGSLILQEGQQKEFGQINCEDWPRLRKRMKFPMRQLLLEGLSVNDSAVIRILKICQALR